MSQNFSQRGRGGGAGGGGGRGWRGRYRNFSRARGNRKPYQTPQQLSQPTRPKPVVSSHSCPYRKWSTYMREEAFIPDSDIAKKITILYQYFLSNIHQFNKEKGTSQDVDVKNQMEIEEKGEAYIDFQALVTDTALTDSIPSLKEDIRNNPDQMLNGLGLALHEALIEDQFSDDRQSVPVAFDVSMIHIRLLSYEPITALKNLKASYFGKLVTIRGTVVRTGNVKPLVTKLAFSCNSCKEEQVVHLVDGKYAAPTSCISSECRGKVFSPLRSSSQTETIDWQNIKLQEIMLDDQREAGRIPRTVECELTYDLVDSCVPGDMVTCTGIVKVTSSDEGYSRGKDKSMYLLYIHAVTISNNKEVHGKDQDSNNQHTCSDFTIKELYAIQEIQGEENLFQLIVGSLCPAIYGHELVKAGLILALFGGSQKFVDKKVCKDTFQGFDVKIKNNIPIRGDPHVLIVGDPGLGKSQMLQAAANVAPRGVYVCGNTTTSSGLTVTLSKESGTGDYALEAGALVLGDRGCCCIDEFDKMGSQHQALLEAMEQQSISIAKAGIVCSLPARTSILAAANPVGGHYNKAKTVSENLKMNSALLSRFDLVFILLDKPDEEMDGILSEHVMSLHTDKISKNRSRHHAVSAERNQDGSMRSFEQWQQDKALSEKLKVLRSEEFDPIPTQLLRKYIQYARKYVYPKLSTDAAKVLQDFYLDLRKQHQGPNCTPITTRQLEALMRLTEARARLELREKATEQDARDVVEIMKSSLIDTLTDDTGSLDFTRSQNGSGMSKRAQCKKFIAELTSISTREQNSVFTVEFMFRIANQLKLQIGNFDDFIATLNNQNFLLKKGPKLYQLQTSSCL